MSELDQLIWSNAMAVNPQEAQLTACRDIAFGNFPHSYFGGDANTNAHQLLLSGNAIEGLTNRLEDFTRHIAENYPYLSHASPGFRQPHNVVLKIGAQRTRTSIAHDWAIVIEVRTVNNVSCPYIVRSRRNPAAQVEIALPLEDDAAWANVFNQNVDLDGGDEPLKTFLNNANERAREGIVNLGLPFFPFNRLADNHPIVQGNPNGARPMLPKNLILYGPPGTGKTFATSTAVVAAFAHVGADQLFDDAERNVISACADAVAERSFVPAVPMESVFALYSKLVRAGFVKFVTFHQSYSYEDFVEGIRARVLTQEQGGRIDYYIESGVFKSIAESALKHWYMSNVGSIGPNTPIFDACRDAILGAANSQDALPGNASSMSHVLVIDEINRGNVAKIFGELITLIEDSKRAVLPGHRQVDDGDQPIGVLLPLSKVTMYLPPNLFLIGTMNTADRALIGMDMAMRRRFSFIELLPNYSLLADKSVTSGNLSIRMNKFLEALNRRVQRYDCPEHMIGHAYFMKVSTFEELKTCMLDKVIPQLRENLAGNIRVLRQVLDFRERNSVDDDSLVDGNGIPHDGRVNDLSFYTQRTTDQ